MAYEGVNNDAVLSGHPSWYLDFGSQSCSTLVWKLQRKAKSGERRCQNIPLNVNPSEGGISFQLPISSEMGFMSFKYQSNDAQYTHNRSVCDHYFLL